MAHFHLQVKPNSKVDDFFMENGVLKAKIKAPATEGKANKYLIELLSKKLDIAKSKIILVNGTTSSHKTFQIEMEQSEIFEKLNV